MAHHHDEHRAATQSTKGKTDPLADTHHELARSRSSPARHRDMQADAAQTHEHVPDRHAGHSVRMFRTRFWLSLVLTIPTVAFGHMIPSALGREPPSFPGS